MHEIGLIYKGKKKPFQFDNPKTGRLRFTPGAITWVPVKAAEFLMSVNPQMFTRSGERGAGISDESVEVKDAAEIIKNKAEQDAEENEALEAATETDAPPEVEPENTAPESEAPDFLPPCPKCGRKYHKKYQKWYDQHIAKCEG